MADSIARTLDERIKIVEDKVAAWELSKQAAVACIRRALTVLDRARRETIPGSLIDNCIKEAQRELLDVYDLGYSTVDRVKT